MMSGFPLEPPRVPDDAPQWQKDAWAHHLNVPAEALIMYLRDYLQGIAWAPSRKILSVTLDGVNWYCLKLEGDATIGQGEWWRNGTPDGDAEMLWPLPPDDEYSAEFARMGELSNEELQAIVRMASNTGGYPMITGPALREFFKNRDDKRDAAGGLPE